MCCPMFIAFAHAVNGHTDPRVVNGSITIPIGVTWRYVDFLKSLRIHTAHVDRREAGMWEVI